MTWGELIDYRMCYGLGLDKCCFANSSFLVSITLILTCDKTLPFRLKQVFRVDSNSLKEIFTK